MESFATALAIIINLQLIGLLQLAPLGSVRTGEWIVVCSAGRA